MGVAATFPSPPAAAAATAAATAAAHTVDGCAALGPSCNLGCPMSTTKGGGGQLYHMPPNFLVAEASRSPFWPLPPPAGGKRSVTGVKNK